MANITTNCECNDIPELLLMYHTFHKFGKFRFFLLNNKIFFDTLVYLTYSPYALAWQNVSHFSGIGLENNSKEIWTLRYEFMCSNILDNTMLGDYTWHYNLTVTREQQFGDVKSGPTSIKKSVSKIAIVFAPRRNTKTFLDFSFYYNGTCEQTLELLTNIVAVQTKVTDNIGIFDGDAWQSNPTLIIRIIEQEPPASPPTFNLRELDGVLGGYPTQPPVVTGSGPTQPTPLNDCPAIFTQPVAVI
jgi:hypothetical protein